MYGRKRTSSAEWKRIGNVLETILRNPSVTGKSSETICSFGIRLTLKAKGIENQLVNSASIIVFGFCYRLCMVKPKGNTNVKTNP